MSKVNIESVGLGDAIAFHISDISAIATTTNVKEITRPTVSVAKQTGSDDISPWGADNDFPQQVIKDVRIDTEIGAILDKKARLLYSGGITFGTLERGDNGTEILKAPEPNIAKTIDDFFIKSNINLYLMEAAKDLAWFYNVYPELVRSKDMTKIVQLCVQASEECRWSKQNPKTGLIEYCYINANFPDAKSTDTLTKKLPVLDPYYDPAGRMKENTKDLNFIYPISYPSPGNKFYQLADWNSIRSSGWLDVSKLIPAFKKALLENQLTIKYHIKISDQFWGWKFPDWGKKTEVQKKKAMQEELDKFVKLMKGTDKTGAPFISSFKTDPGTGKEYQGWIIDVIDDKLKDGKYLEDGKEASAHKMAALGLHPALVGTMPNSGLGGAGSNIREAYNLFILENQPNQDLLLAPLYVVRDYNGWGPEIVFRFKNSLMTTLDTGKEKTNITK